MLEQYKPKQRKANPMHDWFLTLYDQRKNKQGYCECFECGRPVYDKYNTTIYSHLIPKSKYKAFAMDPENVKIVHFECHTLYEMRPSKAVNQYRAAQEYKLKHNI